MTGIGEAASVGDPGPSIGPAPTAVQVDLELLRGAPARLEVPTPDGSVLSAERSVFEDRGGMAPIAGPQPDGSPFCAVETGAAGANGIIPVAHINEEADGVQLLEVGLNEFMHSTVRTFGPGGGVPMEDPVPSQVFVAGPRRWSSRRPASASRRKSWATSALKSGTAS